MKASMRPVERALWYIESHLEGDLSLDEVAVVAGVSPFHLTRAFGYTIGRSVIRYVRHRRLSIAAKRLAQGQKDILDLAIQLGYGSHEAFTRAFQHQFCIAPQQVREAGNAQNLDLLEAIRLKEVVNTNLTEPRIVSEKSLLLAGIARTYTHESSRTIPGQWAEFNGSLGKLPGQKGNAAYGVCYNDDEEGNFNYLCAYEVSDFNRIPSSIDRLRIPEHRYAVFAHNDHVSAIRGTWAAILGEWLPNSTYEAADAPAFELYFGNFDPRTGVGGMEVWVPVTEK